MNLPTSLTVEALKRRIDKQLPGDDELLEEYLEAAFRQAQAPSPLGCGRLLEAEPALVGPDEKDEAAPITREFDMVRRRVVIPDARLITAVSVDGETIPSTEYRALKRDGVIVRLEFKRASRIGYQGDWSFGPTWMPERVTEWSERVRKVEVTGKFGMAPLPEDLREAILILAARLYFERGAEYADQVALAEGQTALQYFRQLPPRVRLAWETYGLAPATASLLA